jgi:ABC-type phosphate transport system substrate-binding protein
MKTNRDQRINLRLPLLCLALVGAMFCQAAHAQVVIISNPGVSAVSVSRTELRDVFTGISSSLKGNVQVIPVLLRQCAANEDFLDLYIGKSDSAFRAGWRSILFSGEGAMAKTLDSETAVVEYVARTPGAIGYISRATPHEGVKVLVVR